MTVRDSALDLATTLSTRLGASYTLGTNVFAGPVRPSQPGAGIEIFCLTTGGGPSIPYRGTDAGNGPDQLRAHSVQIRIRSAQDEFQAAEAVTKLVRDSLNFRPPTGYGELRVRESTPNYLGRTEDGRFEWSINLDASTEETAA